MSYIDNSKVELHRLVYMLETENEMLINQIRKIKIELNELLDSTKRTETTDDQKREGTIIK